MASVNTINTALGGLSSLVATFSLVMFVMKNSVTVERTRLQFKSVASVIDSPVFKMFVLIVMRI